MLSQQYPTSAQAISRSSAVDERVTTELPVIRKELRARSPR
jgi:hypothetical protein